MTIFIGTLISYYISLKIMCDHDATDPNREYDHNHVVFKVINIITKLVYFSGTNHHIMPI